MSTCEWCGLEIQEKHNYITNVAGNVPTGDYHYDCLKYGATLDTEAIGWEPTVVPTETE